MMSAIELHVDYNALEEHRFVIITGKAGIERKKCIDCGLILLNSGGGTIPSPLRYNDVSLLVLQCYDII